MQGMGNLANASVIAICMAFFQQTGNFAGPKTPENPNGLAFLWNGVTYMGYTGTLTVSGCKSVLCLTFGFGTFVCVVMVLYRFLYLQESEVCG